MPAPSPEQDPRVYFAAERTFLAWIRTGLALMGFGFVVARFGLFLRELQFSSGQTVSHATGLSLYMGIGLVALGVITTVSSIVHHVLLIRQLRTGTWIAGHASKTAIALAAFLSVVGVAIVLYLQLVH